MKIMSSSTHPDVVITRNDFCRIKKKAYFEEWFNCVYPDSESQWDPKQHWTA